MRILGIHDGHNAAACLMVDGSIRYAIQEERPTGEKNKSGLPVEAINAILKKAELSISDIDVIGISSKWAPYNKNKSEWFGYYQSFLSEKLVNTNVIKNRLKNIPLIAAPFEKKNKQNRLRDIVNKTGAEPDKIKFLEHHALHAATAYYGNGDFDNDVLVLTNDGAGDRLCASVNIGKQGRITRIAEVHENHSIGLLYAVFTFLTGMMPLEHEYKLMGMAPYANKAGARKVADEFHTMFEFSQDGLTWKFTKSYSIYTAMKYFKDFMFLKRFDSLMGGLQLFSEEFLIKWIRACIKKTGIRNIALSGGVFMNVKANQRIMEMEEVESVFVFPSCGDESNAIGICYHLQNEMNSANSIERLEDIYFGASYTNSEIQDAFNNYSFKHQYNITRHEEIEKIVASLLFEGKVVGRFKGREEFGARSLGNRAILANPGKADVVREINEMIKSRDFWMPFACSIIDSCFDRYVVTCSKASPFYMMSTYCTTPAANEIAGGIHPYDKTVRPQIVTRKHNADYWNLITEFKDRTGIGAVLNTSLNIHGLPLAHKPQDAFHVLEHSELKYLAIESLLIEKLN